MKQVKKAPTVGMVSLGCPKALVDSERIMTQLRSEGYDFSATHDGADVVIVNTCGFLDSAKEESLAAIGDALKENGKVIVTGCMGAEPESITKIHPKVMAVTGPQQYEDVVGAVHDVVAPVHDPYVDLVPEAGLKLTPRHYAYLKISEGCNNRCTFCIIPSLRGDLVSRPAHHVLFEAEKLVNSGVKELLVISQDTSAYGVDLKYADSPWKGGRVRAKFYDLCAALGDMGVWVRLHYVYPYPHVDDVIPLMADGKILPYLDIPFQHASPNVLKAMKRPGNVDKIADRIGNWRKQVPDLTLRSTFIVGFPGETESDFEMLLDFMKDAKIDRAGCFKYEAVQGAKANDIDGAIPEEVKQERYDRFMQVQQGISAAKSEAKIDTIVQCIVDEVDGEGGADARSMADAPEIDGKVFLRDVPSDVKQGDYVSVLVEDADAYDLYGVVVE
ncbi:30S ribosomal protein S12 methylthiotransferase RimO [Micavibrio aeruginosavorus]|uniref:Ribosomal protein uS12 methylthiotransferase RimO n=1 Tax=Micavibrio aeruginosavorus EPB TaxID=349215 RepID=M4VGH1_9BACT|nr:30S ribosomal protein S12 methylthiotransferase RimO [Micavibrio aeruginosavorus]AGH97146.1 SAM-dependent methylase [Micavibrio aeruginosavorus EPB]